MVAGVAHEAVEILHHDVVAGKRLQHLGQSAGMIGHADGQHIGELDGIAVVGNQLDRLFVIRHDAAQNAEMRGIRHGQGHQVDVIVPKKLGKMRQTAGGVLDKNGDLLYVHGWLLLISGWDTD